NQDAAIGLSRLLTLSGKDVCVVNDGPSALAQIDSFQPQVVLLDLGMPGMDGIETAMRIRARVDGQRIMLIALTGWGQDRDRNETQAAGFALHLIKPVNLDHLEAVLDRLAKPYDSRERESACGSERCSS